MIVEQGTHNELIASSGLYRKLYEMQFLVNETPALKQEHGPTIS